MRMIFFSNTLWPRLSSSVLPPFIPAWMHLLHDPHDGHTGDGHTYCPSILLPTPPAGNMMLSIYNCSLLPKATYNVHEPATQLITNARPYCAELFNPRWAWTPHAPAVLAKQCLVPPCSCSCLPGCVL